MLTAHAKTDGQGVVSQPAQLSITGHSLGSALVTLYVVERLAFGDVQINTSCTFASPKVGDAMFASSFDGLSIPIGHRIYNHCGAVPNLPPSWLVSFVPVGTPQELFIDTGSSCTPAPACTNPFSTAPVKDVTPAVASPVVRTTFIKHGAGTASIEVKMNHHRKTFFRRCRIDFLNGAWEEADRTWIPAGSGAAPLPPSLQRFSRTDPEGPPEGWTAQDPRHQP